jgi:sulfide dehydrogenase cytochrome subunit
MKNPKRPTVGLVMAALVGLGSLWFAASSADAAKRPPRRTTTSSTTVGATNAGRILAGNCFQCHGTNGRGGPWEGIAGESSAKLYSELKELQTEADPDEAIMRAHALGYTDAQLKLIADYFAGQR